MGGEEGCQMGLFQEREDLELVSEMGKRLQLKICSVLMGVLELQCLQERGKRFDKMWE